MSTSVAGGGRGTALWRERPTKGPRREVSWGLRSAQVRSGRCKAQRSLSVCPYKGLHANEKEARARNGCERRAVETPRVRR
eukprot:scaffold79236_cov32-Tisochrysis_lutea.AAC.6